MCGIVGVITNSEVGLTAIQQAIFDDMLVCDQVRGDDSTGVFAVNQHFNLNWLKLASHPVNLLKSPKYASFSGKVLSENASVLIGHNRKATSGFVSNENAHPFVHENIVLIHNGGIPNYPAIVGHKNLNKYKVQVDSHAIAIAFAKNDPATIIAELRGTFVFVWYDILKKTLSIVRNKERPLAFVSGDKSFYIASEIDMLKWIVGRRLDVEKAKFAWFKENVINTFHLDTKTITTQEIKVKEPIIYSLPTPVTVTKVERTVTPLKKGSKESLQQLFEAANWNIHYGSDLPVIYDKDKPQLLVFKMVDFRPEDPKKDGKTKQVWEFWGDALDSKNTQVRSKYYGTEEEMEVFSVEPVHVGLVRSVTKMEGDLGHFEVFVVRPKPATLMTMDNGMEMLKEHHDFIMSDGVCMCGHKTKDVNQKDITMDIMDAKCLVRCQWCKDANLNEPI